MRICRVTAIFVIFEKLHASTLGTHVKKAKKAIFGLFFGRFSIYLAPSGAKYCEKGLAAIGKSFGKGLGRFWKVLRVLRVFCACFAHVLRMFWKS